MSKFLVSIFSFSVAIFLSGPAQALPLPSHWHKGLMTESIPQSFTTNYNFEGIVGLDDCSGSLVRLETSVDTDRALVMTNGHCLESGMPAYKTFVYGQQSSRDFNLFNAAGDTVTTLSAAQVVYSTMTGTDVTIYSLNETYGEILSKYGVHALVLSSQHPQLQNPIEVISGYWHRGYTCGIEKFITHLKEDQWTSDDSIRYSRPGCETIGGTSGSPVVLVGTRTIVGINNTGNDDGEQCTMDNPCEIDDAGQMTAVKGYSYGQQTYLIYSCLNANREIDLATPGCKLFH